MMGLMGNVAEVDYLRPHLMQSQYITIFRSVLRRLFIASSVRTVAELFTDADDAYFLRMLSSKNHVLQTFLPERQAPAYSLRVKSCNKALIDKTTDLNERNFLIRVFMMTATDSCINLLCMCILYSFC